MHLMYLTTEVFYIIFTHEINKIKLYSAESDDHRQLFLSFLLLAFLGLWNFKANSLLTTKAAHSLM